MHSWWGPKSAAYGPLETRVPSRHLCLFAAFCLEIVGGSVYTFGIYSGALRAPPLRLSQSHLDWCAFASNLGNFLPISGLVFQSIGGPRTAAAGGLIVMLGYLGLWLVVSYPPGGATPNFIATAVCCLLWGHGAGYMDTAAVASASRNFPQHRGRVLGVTKALFGLGSALLTNVYMAILFPHKVTFILLLALICGTVAILLAPLLSMPPEVAYLRAEAACLPSNASLASAPSEGPSPGVLEDAPLPVEPFSASVDLATKAANRNWIEARLEKGFWITTGLIGAMLAVSIPQAAAAAGPVKDRLYDVGAVLAVVAIAVLAQTPRGAGPLYVVVPDAEHTVDASSRPPSPSCESAARHTPPQPLASASLLPSSARIAALASMTPVASLQELLHSKVFWLVYATFFVGFGAGLFVANNAGQIVRSAGGSDADISAIVSLFSLSNGFGRLFMGRVADHLSLHTSTRRTILAPVAALATAMTFGALAVGAGTLPVLYGTIPLAGLSYGGFWCLSPTLLGDLFGNEILPQAYTMMNTAALLGSLTFSNLLAAQVYEAHDDPATHDCNGPECFRIAFLVTACASWVATATGSELHRVANRTGTHPHE